MPANMRLGDIPHSGWNAPAASGCSECRSMLAGHGPSSLVTMLENKQYMISVREKMNNIKKAAEFYNYDFLSLGK